MVEGIQKKASAVDGICQQYALTSKAVTNILAFLSVKDRVKNQVANTKRHIQRKENNLIPSGKPNFMG